MEDYLTLHRGEPGWPDVLTRNDIDIVLWKRNEPLPALLAADPGWHLTYSDEGWVVYQRT